jgi:hypothetical protein
VCSPLRFDDFWDWDKNDQDRHFDVFDDRSGTLVRDVGNLRVFDLWQRELIDFLLGLLPAEMKGVEFTQMFGVHKAQFGHYKRKKQMPRPELAHAWLRKFRKTYPPIRYDLVYDAVAVSTAKERVIWQEEAPNLSAYRRQRLELRDVSIRDAVLSYALAAPGDINKAWITLAGHFKNDLYQAIERAEFLDFLSELLAWTSQMFGQAAFNPLFTDASNHLADIDLDCHSDVVRLVKDIQRVWNDESLMTHLTARSWADAQLS